MTLYFSIYKFSTVIIALAIIFTTSLSGNIKAGAEAIRIPYDACELSKSYPTFVTKIETGPLTQTILLVNCKLVEVFPSITAAGQYYTPKGQYTIDYAYMQELAILNNIPNGTINLKTPFWMPYGKLMNGDYGQWAGRNMFAVHGAPWRTHSEFTGEKEIYIGGSHGCTNVEDANAEIFFEYVKQYKSKGQKVKVFNY
jgi:L,D-transpeptidase catalytic domain